MNLNKRTIISFTFLFVFLVLVCLGFFFVQKSERVGRAPKLLRSSFIWNEKIWRILHSNERQSVVKPNPKQGKAPRVNGSLGLLAPLALKDFKIKIDNNGSLLELTITDIKLLPKTDYATDFRCIEGWSEEMHFAGVKFKDFLNHYQLGKKRDGSYYNYVGLETPDGQYYVSIDMESMLHDQTLLAYEMNQAPLSLKNGAPLRLAIPIKYGIKSIKRIGRIFFSDVRPKDYWAERGYDWFSGL